MCCSDGPNSLTLTPGLTHRRQVANSTKCPGSEPGDVGPRLGPEPDQVPLEVGGAFALTEGVGVVDVFAPNTSMSYSTRLSSGGVLLRDRERSQSPSFVLGASDRRRILRSRRPRHWKPPVRRGFGVELRGFEPLTP